MAHGHEADSEADSRGDTHEFAALPPEGIHEQRKELELVGNYQIPIEKEFQHPIELRLGRDEQTPLCYLVRYPWQFGQRYAIVQPEVVRTQPGRGWVEFGEGTKANNYTTVIGLGRQTPPQLDFGPDVSWRHCLVANDDDAVHIENYGRNGLRALVHQDDLAGEVIPFDPDPDYWR